jgi:hypothetical protein
VAELGDDLFKIVRVLEVAGAAVGGVEACQIEVAATLARRLAIALDLSPLALIAGNGDVLFQESGILALVSGVSLYFSVVLTSAFSFPLSCFCGALRHASIIATFLDLSQSTRREKKVGDMTGWD